MAANPPPRRLQFAALGWRTWRGWREVMAMLAHAMAQGIRGYQLFISPYKGFHCAYKARSGRWSCSEYARRLVLRLGSGALLRGLPGQFARCKAAYLALMARYPAAADRRRTRRRWTDCCDCCDPSCLPDVAPCDGSF